MKRALLLTITFVYLLSSIGIAVNKFYCCGELKSISLSETSPMLDDCKMPVKEDGCCDIKSQTFKVKDQHLKSVSITALSVPAFIILQSFHKIDFDFTVSPKDIPDLNYRASLVSNSVPIHGMNCTYKI